MTASPVAGRPTANAASPAVPAARPDPAPLFDLAVAYWRSCALFTALDLNLFPILGDDALDSVTLATRLECPLRSLRLLLDALVALNLLTRDADGRYANTPTTRTFLVPGTPAYLAESIQFNARGYGAWGRLTDAVRQAKPTMDPNHFLGQDEAATRNFVLAMHGRAMGVARCLVGLLDLGDRHRLLDIGGGPATYSRLLVERHPQLHATVLDLPGVIAVAEQLVADSPARERLTLRAGDLYTADFGTGFDVVLISGVLHRTDGQGTVDLLTRAAAALAPGGLLAVSDLFTGGETQGPVLPELFSLHMLITNDSGASLPLPEMPAMLAAAGLEFIETRSYPTPLPHLLLLARKA